MDRRVQGIIAVLVAAVVGLTVALVVVIARDSDGGAQVPDGMAGSGSSMGMMQAMGDMDSDAMLTHMREVLGEDGYERMLEHFRDHRSGGPMTGDAAVDGMMHQMMDGMLQQMPDDSGQMMPVMPGMTSTPAATGTQTPGQ